MSDKMRAEFESWLSDNGMLALKEESGEYSFQHARCAWRAWQASRAALVVELPDAWKENNDMVIAENELKLALDGAGVSYK